MVQTNGESEENKENLSVKKRLEEITKVLTQTADGNLSLTIERSPSSELNPLEDALEKVLANFKLVKENMTERVKELNCLYGISKVLEHYGSLSSEALEEIVSLIPPAFHYPASTTARITIDDCPYVSADFRETDCRLSAEIKEQGTAAGLVEVYVDKETIPAGKDCFLKEESTLLEEIADRLSKTIQRNRTEDALQRDEELIKALLNASTESMLLLDTKANILALNQITAQRFNKTAEEIIGRNLADFVPPEVYKLRKAMLDRVVSSGESVRFQDERQGRHFDSTVNPVLDEKGKVSRIATFAVDITEQKHQQEDLNLKALVLDSVNDSVFLHDFDGNFIYLNEKAYKTLGYTKEEMMSINLHDLDAPEYEKLIESRIKILLEKGEAVFESANLRKDKSALPIEVSCRLIKTGEKNLLLSVIRDITKRKELETALEKENEKMAVILDNMKEYVLLLDKNNVLQEVNDYFCHFVSLGRDFFIGKRLADLKSSSLHGIIDESELRESDAIIDQLEKITKNLKHSPVLKPFTFQTRLLSQELFVSISPIYLKEQYSGAVISATNVTELVYARKKAEISQEIAKKENAKLSAILDNIQEGIFFFDPSGTIQEINDYFCRFMGRERKEYIGSKLKNITKFTTLGEPFKEFGGETQRGEIIEQILATAEIFSQKPSAESVTFHARLGLTEVIIRISPVRRGSKYEGTVVNFANVTELVQARQKAEISKETAEKEYVKLSVILDNMQEGVLFLDEKNTIQEANNYYCQFMGKERTEYIGMKAADLANMPVLGKPFRESGGDDLRSEIVRKIVKNAELMRQNSITEPVTFHVRLGFTEVIVRISPVRRGNKYEGTLVSFSNVTELVKAQKKAEAALQEAVKAKQETEKENLKLSSILSSMGQGMFVIGRDNEFLEVNAEYCRFIGRDVSFYRDKKLDYFIQSEVTQIFQKQGGKEQKTDFIRKALQFIEQLRQNPASGVIDYRFSVTDYEFLLRVTPMYRENKYEGAVFIFNDITELVKAQKKVETALQEAVKARQEAEKSKETVQKENLKLSAILDNMEEGLLVVDADNVIMEVNNYYCRFVGQDRSIYIGKKLDDYENIPLSEIFKGEGGLEQRNKITKTFLTILEFFRNNPDSKTVSVQVPYGNAEVIMRGKPIYREGRYEGAIANFINVTELVNARKKAETALMEAEVSKEKAEKENLKLTAILNNMQEGVFLLNADNEFQEVNKYFYQLVKRKPDDYKGKKLEDLRNMELTEELKQKGISFNRHDVTNRVLDIIKQFRKNINSESVTFQFPFVGEEIIMQISPIYRENKYDGAVFNFTNVTEIVKAQRKAEQALQDVLRAKQEAELAKKAVERENLKLSVILSNIEEGLVLTDADNVIQEINYYFCKLVGIKRPHSLGRKLEDVPNLPLPEGFSKNDGKEQLAEIINYALKCFKGFRDIPFSEGVSMQIPLGDAEVIIRAKPIYRQGKYEGAITNFINVTEIVHAKQRAEKAVEELQIAYDKLEAAKENIERINYYKTELMANMSHEFRTPMTSILGFSELLLACELPPDEKKFVEYIINSAKNLLDLLNSFLEISKTEAGKMEAAHEYFNLKELVREAVQTLKPKIKEKGLQSRVFIEEDMPQTFIGDKRHIYQILLNLLSNAVKFTQEGRVTLRVFESEEKQSEYFFIVAISVSDTGIGIEQEKMEMIFEPFNRGVKSTCREYEGTGLGLTLVKKLTDMLGGSIKVESSAGKGSVFTITLPLKVADKE